MFYYYHHIGDFIRDTSQLNDSQCMAYLRLLWLYYDSETPIPDTPSKIAFQIGADPNDVRQILDHYFTFENGFYHQKRCDDEIAAYHSKSKKASESANARWKNANALRPQSERNPNEPVLDANREPRTKSKPKVFCAPNEFFEKFWKAYPKKTGKAEALAEWNKLGLDGETDSIIAALEKQKASADWRKDGGKYILMGKNWIANKRWEDEVTVIVKERGFVC